MRLIAMTIEHQLPYTHHSSARCLSCSYRHTSLMHDKPADEVFSISAGIQHMYTMRPACDKSMMPLSQMKKHKYMIETFKEKILHVMCADANEYIYFTENSALLSSQLLNSLNATNTNANTCTQELFQRLLNELTKKGNADDSKLCDFRFAAIEHADIHTFCFENCIHYWFHKYHSDSAICQFFYMQQSHSELKTRYNVMCDVFMVYRRIVDINLLSAAPYGTVTMSVRTFCSSKALTPLICLAYSTPAAHRLATHENNTIVACVSVAKTESLSDDRKAALSNYAIYLPFDIDAAIYLRFGGAQIARLLQERLQALMKAKIFLQQKQYMFIDINLLIFFDRGVFNAHIVNTEIAKNNDANALRLELVDVYRNAHWMGLSIYHKDASLIFPRITAYLGSQNSYTTKMKSVKNIVNVAEIIADVHSLLYKACAYVEKLQYDREQLYSICQTSVNAAMSSRFAFAHENLRLALSMTHTSTHKYAEYLLYQNRDLDYRYVRMTLLYSGDTGCAQCEQLYVQIMKTHENVSNASFTHGYSVVQSGLQLLTDAQYTKSHMDCDKQLLVTHNITTEDHIMTTMSRLCQVLQTDVSVHYVSRNKLNSIFASENESMNALVYLNDKSYHYDTKKSNDVLLNTLLQVQKDVCKHGTSQWYKLRDNEGIREYINRVLQAQQSKTALHTEQNKGKYIGVKRPHDVEENVEAKKAKTM